MAPALNIEDRNNDIGGTWSALRNVSPIEDFAAHEYPRERVQASGTGHREYARGCNLRGVPILAILAIPIRVRARCTTGRHDQEDSRSPPEDPRVETEKNKKK